MSKLELKVPPVVLVLLVGAAMRIVSAAHPAYGWPLPFRHAIAAAFIVAGIVVAILGVLSFRRAGTTVDPTRPQAASALVDSGIYRFSRNPMYLGFLLALLGWAVYLSNLLAFVLVTAFVVYMNRFQIRPEERALTARFGEPFLAYMKAVRRWI